MSGSIAIGDSRDEIAGAAASGVVERPGRDAVEHQMRALREVGVLELVEREAWMAGLDRRRCGERLGAVLGLLLEPDLLDVLEGVGELGLRGAVTERGDVGVLGGLREVQNARLPADRDLLQPGAVGDHHRRCAVARGAVDRDQLHGPLVSVEQRGQRGGVVLTGDDDQVGALSDLE